MSKVELGLQSVGGILNAAWRRKRLAVGTFAVLFSGIVVVVLSLTPRYTAEALLLLSPLPTADLGDGRSQRVLVATDPFVVRSEVEILTSDELCRRVVEELKLADEPEFNRRSAFRAALHSVVGRIRSGLAEGQGGSPQWSDEEARQDGLLRAYKAGLSVFNDGRSLTVRVSFSAEDPKLASTIANKHAQAYLDAQAGRRVRTQRVASEWLNGEVDARARDLRSAEGAVQSFRAEHGLLLTHGQAQQRSLVDQELALLSEQLTAARADVAKAQARRDQIRLTSEASVLQGTSDMIDSPVLVRLRERAAEAQVDLARTENLFPGGGLGVNSARAVLESVRATIRQELQRIEAALVADLNAAQVRMSLLGAEVDKVKLRKVQLDRAEVELRGLESIAASKRGVYEAALNRYNVLLAEQNFGAADAKVVSAATIPTRAAFPKTTVFLALGLCISFGSAIGAAFAAERLRPGTTSLKALSQAVQLRPLAAVPLREEAGSRPSQFWKALFWERIRNLRMSLRDINSEHGTVILVTSSLPQEGKSRIAAALAESIASIGVPTLLLDGDLRHPSAAFTLGVEDQVSVGLGEVLGGEVGLDEAILPVGPGRLSLLPAAPDSVSRVDALATEHMRQVVEKARRKFNVVVIDTPPVGVVSDALALAALADQTIVVARSSRTPVHLVERTVNVLRDRGVHLAGLVLTGTDEDDAILSRRDLRLYYVGRPSSHRGLEISAEEREPRSVEPLPSTLRRWRADA